MSEHAAMAAMTAAADRLEGQRRPVQGGLRAGGARQEQESRSG